MTRDEHLAVIGMEECQEVAQRLSKALRFGMEEVQPVETGGDGVTNNRDRIWAEWCDLVAMMRMLGIPCASVTRIEAKRAKVESFLLYSENCGTLAASALPDGMVLPVLPSPSPAPEEGTGGYPDDDEITTIRWGRLRELFDAEAEVVLGKNRAASSPRGAQP